jgi:glycerol-3-phosphate dehydrogenase (NAD+)
MWVHEEYIKGRRLTDVINNKHENVKYMPNVKLPTNIIADPDIASATKDANVLIFVLPHQFLDGLCEKIAGHHAPDCIAISLINAVQFDDSGIVLVSSTIRAGLRGMDVSVLMGANIASEVASGAFCETTIGCADENHGMLLRQIFDAPLFHVSVVKDVAGPFPQSPYVSDEEQGGDGWAGG